MKLLNVVLVFAMLLISVPAVASNEFENGDAARWAALQYPNITYQEYNETVDELVQVQAELDEMKAEAPNKRNDTIALALAAGVFIGSGGVAAAVKLLFPLCKVIPFL